MSNRHLYWLAGTLATIGLVIFLYKSAVLGFPVTPGTTSEMWDVEVRLRFQAKDRPVKVSMYIPSDVRPYSIVDENFVSRGYGLTTARTDSNRQAVWSLRRADGLQTLYYRVLVQRVEMKETPVAQAGPGTDVEELAGARRDAASALLAEIQELSADRDTLVAQLMQRLYQPGRDTNAALLVGRKADAGKRIETAVQVLALDNIPARLIRGVRLAEGRDVELLPWLQVHDGKKQWRFYHPDTGETGPPDDYLVLWRGTEDLVQIDGGRRLEVMVSVRRSEQASMLAAAVRSSIVSPHLLQFSLFSLPLQTQEVYRVLLLIPLAAFLLVIFRNVVGVNTFGTFMPVLIALAFRETQLLWGIALFTLVVALGLAMRFYLDRLKLLVVPRLAAVLIVVILLMAGISIVSHQLGLERGLSIALFPMVILTMTIERMSIVWDERGPAEAIEQGAGSLVVASLAYLVISNGYVGHIVFVFPELLLLVLALTLLLGRYSGYRLLELRRFRVLARDKT
ncbi:MAG: inactive transglutaminase family protein [Gammaproteobacteria bacterium]|nr:inactive transglutaminase family protein [Gammaproteobacteria bacterium]MDH3560083.1 inactive transglutaminase family protein [Gammaproteobacteria bacterium]